MGDALIEAAQALVDAGKKTALSVGFAESCTAGLCASSVGSIPGASSVLAGGVVSYMLSVKERVLGVDAGILYDEKLGPVSAECAEAMARGARGLLGCDVCVSVTGLAGPDGAEPGKPIGTVWFGFCSAHESFSELCRFSGSRDEIRISAAKHALGLAREGLVKEDILRH